MNILIDSQTLYTPEIKRGIGVYFIEMIEAILKVNTEHDFYLLVTNSNDLKIFSKFASSNLLPVTNKKFNDFFSDQTIYDKKYTNLYSELINEVIKLNKIDAYWTPNTMMDNVFLPKLDNPRVKTFATIYDLIPLIMRDLFLEKWDLQTKNFYKTKLKLISQYKNIFFISKSGHDDYIKNVSNNKNQVKKIIYPGISDRYKPSSFPNEQEKDYFLYVGGFDPRKNMSFAIEAFATFKKKHKTDKDIYLKIVCSANNEEKKQIKTLACELNVLNSVELTGYVSDEELLKLYQHCSVFFFPSLYEGFGLPIVEALACGKPVASSKTSSMVEIGGDLINYFNPKKINEAVEALYTSYLSSDKKNLIKKRVNYVKKFNWIKAANNFVSTLDDFKIKEKMKTIKKTIAWVSPLAPSKSGISNYSYKLIKELKKDIQVDLYYDQGVVSEEVLKEFACYPIHSLANKKNKYDEIFYNIGNHILHKKIYKMAILVPGTVILHDYFLQSFLDHSFLRSDVESDKNYFYDVFIKNYNFDKKTIVMLTKDGIPSNLWKYSCNDEIVNCSKRVIVHSRWLKRQFKKNKKIDVIPHFSFWKKPSTEEVSIFRNKYKIPNNAIVFSILGHINKNKFPLFLLESLKSLQKTGYPIYLLLAGSLSDELKNNQYYNDFISKESWVNNTGYLNWKYYFSAFQLSDLIINIRIPSMGETSAVLTQAIAANKPVLVYNKNQYSELYSPNIFRISPSITDAKQFTRKLESLLVPALKYNQSKVKNNYINLEVADLAKKYLQ